MKFTFKAKKIDSAYHVTVRCNGELLFVRIGETRAEALHAARMDAEAYGYIDGADFR